MKGTRSVRLTGNTENRRNTPNEFRAESESLVRSPSLARKSPGGTFGAAVFPERDAKAESDSSSYSCSPSVATDPRGRSCASESSREYEPSHWWSDHGQERLDEAVAREKKERRRVKDRSRARSRSRGQAKSTKRSRARTARSGMHPEDDIFNKCMAHHNAIFRQRDLLWLGRETDEAQAQGHPAKQQSRVRRGPAPAVRPTRHEEEATRPPNGQPSQDPYPSPSPSPSSFPCAKSQWPTTKAQRQITKPQWRSCKGHPSPAPCPSPCATPHGDITKLQ